MKSISILGSTGSIGTQASEVVERNPDCLRVVALAAGTNVNLLAAQIRAFKPDLVSVKGPVEAEALSELLKSIEKPPDILHGPDGLKAVALHPQADTILNGLVGAVGFRPTIDALKSGREVLLANKESLVMAGELIRDILYNGSGKLVPVDSEHSAIYQCLGCRLDNPGLDRLVLTASGGPFRDTPREQFENISVHDALAHPTWKMGPKITIDSATLFNKGFEIIEAYYLFNVPPEKIDVVIHPASIVHSFVEFKDGSMLAQLSHPTMEVPIQHALLGGERRPTRVKKLDLAQVGNLEFFPPDPERFPSLDLARLVLTMGGTAPAVLNGANEQAVGLFLDEKIKFPAITRLVRSAIECHDVQKASEEAILAADLWARDFVISEVGKVIH